MHLLKKIEGRGIPFFLSKSITASQLRKEWKKRMHVASGQFRSGKGAHFWRGHALYISGTAEGGCLNMDRLTSTPAHVRTICLWGQHYTAVTPVTKLWWRRSWSLSHTVTRVTVCMLLDYQRKLFPQNGHLSANMAKACHQDIWRHHALTWVSRLLVVVIHYYSVNYLTVGRARFYKIILCIFCRWVAYIIGEHLRAIGVEMATDVLQAENTNTSSRNLFGVSFCHFYTIETFKWISV